MAIEPGSLAPRRRRPLPLRGVLGKELAGLAPFTLVLLLAQGLVWAAPTQAAFTWTSPSASLVRGLFLFLAAALYGALFFGLEPPAVRGFLLQLPIPRSTLLGAKAVAAGGHLALYWGGSEWLARALPRIPALPLPDASDLAGLLLTYVLCAWLSTLTREALTALVGGTVLLGLVRLVSAVLLGSALHLVALCAALGAAAWALWRRLASLEERPVPRLGGLATWRLASSSRRPRLLTLEWRQKWPVLMLLLILPGLSSALYLPGGAPFAFFLWVPIAGAVLGVVLFTEPERRGESFFIHQLPISRKALVRRRMGFALAFGALLSLEFGGVLWMTLRRGASLIPSESILGALYLVALLYVVTFGLGAALSPWLSSSLLGAALVLLTLLALVFVPSLFDLEDPPFARHALLVVGVLALAWWSSVHSRALEPAPGKNLRALWLLLPFWAAAFWSLLTGGS